jgi:transposase
MMRPSNTLAAVYLCVEPIDFGFGILRRSTSCIHAVVRLQINGLAARVEGALLLDPLSEQLFAFTNRRYNRVKVLYWERNGFVLWQKRLERDRFYWPRDERLTVTLNGQELNWLLDGFDLRQWRPHARLNYRWVA